jgi:hypothetical protein
VTQKETSRMKDDAHLLAAYPSFHEPVMWRCEFRIEKYLEGDPLPYDIFEGKDNLLVTNGATLMWQAITGATPTFFNNANARIGVGDGNGSVPTPAIGDTDLTAPTNKLRQAMDATFPTISTNTVTFQSTFASGSANYVWNEWGLFNAASGATSMLNHRGVNIGTKTSAGPWVFSVTLSLA